jgi:hypothetical protein
MNNFNQMSNTELRAYVLSHREDEEAWEIFTKRLEDDPTVIRVPPSLDEAGWQKVEQLIKERSQAEQH